MTPCRLVGPREGAATTATDRTTDGPSAEMFEAVEAKAVLRRPLLWTAACLLAPRSLALPPTPRADPGKSEAEQRQ